MILLKLISKHSNKSSKIRVKIENISGNKVECSHINSGFKVKATIKEGMDLCVGQIVVLEYTSNQRTSGYIVVDDLIEELDVEVLEAHHIISDGVMYTSIIIENPITKSRMHSLIPSYEKLFSSTNVIIKGDKLKIKINNGNIFSIDAK